MAGGRRALPGRLGHPPHAPGLLGPGLGGGRWPNRRLGPGPGYAHDSAGAPVQAQQPLRDDEYGLYTAVDVGLEADVDAMPAGELGDHEEADTAVLEQAGDVDLVGVGEQRVHLVLFVHGHAEAAVLHLDGEPRGHEVGAQQHLGVGGGEHGRVLDEFGEQVDDVGDGVSAQGAVDRGHEFDPRVLLDLRDGRAEHLRHGDRVAPLPAGDGAAENGEVLGMPANAGGEVVDVEEALEEIRVLDLVFQFVEDGDLAVDERLEAPGEVDEDLDLLFAARLAGELRGLDDRGEGAVVGSGEIGAEEFEVVGVGSGCAPRLTGRRWVAAPQTLDQGAQLHLASGTGAAQGAEAFTHGSGGAVGGHQGDDDAPERHADRAGEHGEQGECGPHPGGADDEQDGRAGAEADREGRQHGEPYELGPYLGLGQWGDSTRDRPTVPPALTAVCTGAGARR